MDACDRMLQASHTFHKFPHFPHFSQIKGFASCEFGSFLVDSSINIIATSSVVFLARDMMATCTYSPLYIFSNNTNITQEGVLETFLYSFVSASPLWQMLLMLETLSFVDTMDTNALLFELLARKFSFIVYGIISSLILMSCQNCFWQQH